MYLLTWTWKRLSESAVVFRTLKAVEGEYERIRTSADHRYSLPELFERRGNDWIRIRPEEGQ